MQRVTQLVSVTSVLMEAELPEPRAGGSARALSVNRLDADLSDAVLRLVRLTDAPRDYRVLSFQRPVRGEGDLSSVMSNDENAAWSMRDDVGRDASHEQFRKAGATV